MTFSSISQSLSNYSKPDCFVEDFDLLSKAYQRSPYSIEVTPTGTTVHSVLPDGLRIEKGPYGHCLIATKHFPKGSTLYFAWAAMLDFDKINQTLSKDIPSLCQITGEESESESDSHAGDLIEDPDNFTVKLYSPSGDFLQSYEQDKTNSVEILLDPTAPRRILYGFDGMTNHSCDPNAASPVLLETDDWCSYKTVAIKDIFPGDEVAVDYALYDYHCDGHEIEQCGCGSAKCRGSMRGFQGLSLEEKVSLLHICAEEVVEMFFLEHNVSIFLDKLPDGVKVEHDSATGERYLVASKYFKAGEIAYKREMKIVQQEDLTNGKIFLIKLEDRYYLLDAVEHFMHRQDGTSENYGLDCFTDHSCDPNTDTLYYEGSAEYAVVARRDIHPGDKLTCDYNDIGQNQEVLTGFVCSCGASNCRKFIPC